MRLYFGKRFAKSISLLYIQAFACEGAVLSLLK